MFFIYSWQHTLLTHLIGFKSSNSKDGGQALVTHLQCAAGLAELATKKYKCAARHFLQVKSINGSKLKTQNLTLLLRSFQANVDHCDLPELLSPSNVAVFGGLCALATYDRAELQKHVISSRCVCTSKSYINILNTFEFS